jgi:hypothetical protein
MKNIHDEGHPAWQLVWAAIDDVVVGVSSTGQVEWTGMQTLFFPIKKY